MIRNAVEAYKGIDILFNAAAIFMFGTALDTDERAWRKVTSILLDGTFSMLPGRSSAHDTAGRRRDYQCLLDRGGT